MIQLRGWLLMMLLLVTATLQAQQPAFRVVLSSDRLVPGDTLELEASYSIADRKLPPATLALTLMKEGEPDKFWQMRWPLVNGTSMASIVLPDSMPAGLYNLAFAIQPRFLKMFCDYIYPDRPRDLLAVFSHVGGLQKFPVKATPNRRFALEDILINGDVTLSFQQEDDTEGLPVMMRVDAWLDSSFTPAAYGVKQLAVNLPNDSTFLPQRLQKETFFNGDFSCFQGNYAAQLKAEKVAGLPMTKQFDSLFVPKEFKAGADYIFDCLQDSVANAAPTVYDLLQQRMKGFEISYWGDIEDVRMYSQSSIELKRLQNEMMLQWRGKLYRICLDGMYGDPSLFVFPPNAFGSIRIFEPPFYTEPSSKKQFGTIAFFSKRFPFAQPYPYRSSFIIRGYTPDMYLLPL